MQFAMQMHFFTATDVFRSCLFVSSALYLIFGAATGSKVQNAIFDITGGHRTVPSVWVGGKHIGGHDDTMHAIKSGHLQKLLRSQEDGEK